MGGWAWALMSFLLYDDECIALGSVFGVKGRGSVPLSFFRACDDGL
jgi:hypothetical protein